MMKVTIDEYLEDGAYLCRYYNDNFKPIRDLRYIARANIIDPDYKTTPALRSLLDNDKLQPKSPGPGQFDIEVMLHKGAEAKDTAMTLQSTVDIGGKVSVGRSLLRICSVDRGTINAISQLDAVRAIGPVIPLKLMNYFAWGDIQLRQATADNDFQGTSGEQYMGQGEVVAIADSGLDLGELGNPHPAFALQPDGAVPAPNRVLALLDAVQEGFPSADHKDRSGHGTHVAASVLGDGLFEDVEKNQSTRGTASKAKLVMQTVVLPDGDGESVAPPIDLHDLFLPPYQQFHARVANNSWGEYWNGVQAIYDDNGMARTCDDFVREKWDHVIVFAAGNDGTLKSETGAQIGGAVAAKNIITVGATHSSRNDSYPNLVAEISSRGPIRNDVHLQHRRIKPDLVAPGVKLVSAKSRHEDMTACGDHDQAFPLLRYSTGTSMAAPIVSGCAATLRSALIHTGRGTAANGNPVGPSAALIKALLINGAITLFDHWGVALPMREQGFGRVDMRNSLPRPPPPGADYPVQHGYVDYGIHPEEPGLAMGHTWDRVMTIRDPGPGQHRRFKVTLVYTDLPGQILQNRLLLTLRHIDTGEQINGNIFEDVVRDNNVQQVVWDNIPTGQVSLRVNAPHIVGPDERQTFAIVWRLYDFNPPPVL
ncbi:subtilisin-like protein [Terfezia boudieri ATCC MYA-4762]|uniref:Subtilisin-like protein n=1 Tax=Terfezia boudieri ATCC MYA-4762 TaxID=1051890 RepID=A0A3N4M1U5_9PEZI|nr:subtilisin-like protein [Terfezia boudieri ATCC MYA-4762]